KTTLEEDIQHMWLQVRIAEKEDDPVENLRCCRLLARRTRSVDSTDIKAALTYNSTISSSKDPRNKYRKREGKRRVPYTGV
ncbi:5414_t:CDS:1, partial [Acaulospora colombiana]